MSMSTTPSRGSESEPATTEHRRESNPNECKETPLPWGKLSTLLAVRLSEPVNFMLILPFVYQMVKSFGVAESPKDIAFYASLLFASFSLCQSITIMHWGHLSDRIGRKPVIMVGLVGNLISSALLGTSKTFKSALIARSFNGLMAGNVVVVKSVVAEISDNSNRPRMMAMLPLMFNVGNIAGSAVGGLFADPVKQYPRWFGNSALFKEYPYLLPCLIGCLVTVFGLIVGLFKLEETLVIKNDDVQSSESSSAPSTNTSTLLTPSTESEPLLERRSSQQRSIREMLTPTVVRVMATNVIVCLSLSMMDQIFPIFAATDTSDGGLGMSSRDIGISLSIASVVVIYLQLVTYPNQERKYGALECYKRGQKFFIPVLILFPFLNIIAKQVNVSSMPEDLPSTSRIALWILLMILLLMRVVCNVLVMSSINLLTVNLALRRSELGFMNGLQQLAFSSTRVISPLLGGITWSWSIEHSLPFPFNFHLLWNICALLIYISYRISGRIPQSVNVFSANNEETQADHSSEPSEEESASRAAN